MANSVDVITAAGLLAGRKAAASARDRMVALHISQAAFLCFALVGILLGSGSAYHLSSAEAGTVLTNILINVLFAVCLALLCSTLALSVWLAVPLMLLYQVNIYQLILQYERQEHPALIGMGPGVGSIGMITSSVIFFSFNWQLRTAHLAMMGAAKAQAEMAGYVFHELRNALSAMQGVFDMLAEQPLSSGAEASSQQLLREAQLQAHHAVQVVNNMLDYQKMRVGELTIAFETPFTLSGVEAEVTALVNCLARSKPDIQLECFTPPSLPTLLGSPLHLKQVLLNLLATRSNTLIVAMCGTRSKSPISLPPSQRTLLSPGGLNQRPCRGFG
jgi:signal transduction histidine kinase